MNKIKLTFLIIIIFSVAGYAQKGEDNETRLKNGEDLNMLYRNEASFSIFGHTAGGIGIGYRRGFHANAKRKRMFELEAQNFKHPKEVKTTSDVQGSSKPFYYGKLNAFFIVRPGVGYEHVLYQKSDKKSVEIRCAYFLGGTINFAKPVYLEVKDDPTLTTTSIERYDPAIHNRNNIVGKAPGYIGIESTTIYPGGYAKLAFSFDYASRYNGVKAIETGAIVDVYPQVLPMMAYNKNQQVFVELYLKFVWGKKWF
jgi:hypothetical protein